MRNLIYGILAWTLAIGLSSDVYAQEWRLNLNLYAHHFGEPPEGLDEFNSELGGMGGEFQLTDELYITAGFNDKNSYGEKSEYLGGGARMFQLEHVTIGGELIFANGYGKYPLQESPQENPLELNPQVPDPPQDIKHIWGLWASFGNGHGPKIGYAGKIASIQYQVRFGK